jgi:hypothetical protein
MMIYKLCNDVIQYAFIHNIKFISFLSNGKYDKQEQQGKAAFNEHIPPPPHTHTRPSKKEIAARSPGGTQTKTGQDTRQSTDTQITRMIHK